MPPDMPSIEASYSSIRLVASITLSTLGCVGLWSLAVALPAVQADFGPRPSPLLRSAEPRAAGCSGRRLPLILITGDREKSYHHSRFRDQPWALKVSPDPHLAMHPDTARALGLEDGCIWR